MATGHKAEIQELKDELGKTKAFCNALITVLMQVEKAAIAHSEGVRAITKQFIDGHKEFINDRNKPEAKAQ